MALVRQVSRTGVTVLATIHSPTECTFRLFDRLLLMIGGKIVYHGKTGGPLIKFFNSCGVRGAKDPPSREYTSCSPLLLLQLAPEPFKPGEDVEAEWIVNVSTFLNIEGKGPALVGCYETSELFRENQEDLERLIETAGAGLDEDMRKSLQARKREPAGIFNGSSLGKIPGAVAMGRRRGMLGAAPSDPLLGTTRRPSNRPRSA